MAKPIELAIAAVAKKRAEAKSRQIEAKTRQLATQQREAARVNARTQVNQAKNLANRPDPNTA